MQYVEGNLYKHTLGHYGVFMGIASIPIYKTFRVAQWVKESAPEGLYNTWWTSDVIYFWPTEIPEYEEV